MAGARRAAGHAVCKQTDLTPSLHPNSEPSRLCCITLQIPLLLMPEQTTDADKQRFSGFSHASCVAVDRRGATAWAWQALRQSLALLPTANGPGFAWFGKPLVYDAQVATNVHECIFLGVVVLNSEHPFIARHCPKTENMRGFSSNVQRHARAFSTNTSPLGGKNEQL